VNRIQVRTPTEDTFRNVSLPCVAVGAPVSIHESPLETSLVGGAVQNCAALLIVPPLAPVVPLNAPRAGC
jgi:hypothetical protein